MSSTPLATYQAQLEDELRAQAPEMTWSVAVVRRPNDGFRLYIAHADRGGQASRLFATITEEELKTVPVAELARRVIVTMGGQRSEGTG